MIKQINYYWRVVAKILSFLVFGLGGLLLGLVIFPLLNCVIWQKRLRINMARNIIRWTFRGFIEFMRVIGVLTYHIHDLSRLQRNGLLILANHPTLIDTVFLMAFVKHADCIVKSSLWHNPFTAGPVRAANYIRNNDGIHLIEDCTQSLHGKSNLIIFPQGTRGLAETMVKLRRGAANIAIRSQTNITPVSIRCAPLFLTKTEKWWKVPADKPCFTIAIKEDITVNEIVARAKNETLAARYLNTYLENYFMQEHESYEQP